MQLKLYDTLARKKRDFVPLDWERDHPPAPDALAEAVERVRERLPDYAAAARERSLRFDAKPWVERHREVFERLVAG